MFAISWASANVSPAATNDPPASVPPCVSSSASVVDAVVGPAVDEDDSGEGRWVGTVVTVAVATGADEGVHANRDVGSGLAPVVVVVAPVVVAPVGEGSAAILSCMRCCR